MGARFLVLAVAFLSATASAWAQARPEHPLVLIPGILGSELATADGQVVWGGASSLRNLDRLDTLSGTHTVEPLHATRLIEAINVLGPFWAIHQYDGLLRHLAGLGYVEGRNLFTFPYDWRRSNFETARDLGAFVDRTPALAGTRFDLLSHSMGGLVAKIWMLEGGGASRVRRAVYMGTPFRGSMNAFATLSDGWGTFGNLVAGGIDTVRRVSLSFASLYELMPNYPGCCRLGTPSAHRPLDVLEPTTWRSRDWLPPEYIAGAPRATFFDEGLARARRIGSLASRPVPGVDEVLFAGDVIETGLYLYVPEARQGWRDWTFRKSRGDGTVPVWSAANAWDTLKGSEPTFAAHATIFEDRYLLSKLDRLLVSDAPPPVRAEALGEARTPDGRTITLDLVRAEIDPPLARPDGATTLTIALDFQSAVGRGDLVPTVRVSWLAPPNGAVPLVETTTDADVAMRRLTYSTTFTAPSSEATHRIDVDLPGQGTRTLFLTVAGPTREQR